MACSLAGCEKLNAPPSSGDCTGVVDGVNVGGPMDAGASEFHRDDQQGGIEHAFVNVAYSGTASTFRITGFLSDMPAEEDEGAHALPPTGNGAGLVQTWTVAEPATASLYSAGTLTLTRADRDRLEGSFAMSWSDGGAVDCTIDLRRAYNLDTDD